MGGGDGLGVSGLAFGVVRCREFCLFPRHIFVSDDSGRSTVLACELCPEYLGFCKYVCPFSERHPFLSQLRELSL